MDGWTSELGQSKLHYQCRISEFIMNQMEETDSSISAMDLAKKIIPMDVVMMSVEAWNSLKTVSNCNCCSKYQLIIGPKGEERELNMQLGHDIDDDLPICCQASDNDVNFEVREEFRRTSLEQEEGE